MKWFIIKFFCEWQEYKSILDKAEPHLLLDVRPLVEVDICRLPFSLSILDRISYFFLRVSSSLNKFAVIFLILLPDIPLSCLEERKLEDVQLLKRRIDHLRQGRSGDFQPPGNSKTPLWTGTYTYAQCNVSACFGLLGLLGDPFSKTIAVNPCSWSALVKWICKRLF